MNLVTYSLLIGNALNILDQAVVHAFAFFLKNTRGIIYTCGNGGSGTTASHFTQDLVKACNIRSICLNDNIGLITAITNDSSYESVFGVQVERLMTPLDILFVISGSGNSLNLVEALHMAKYNTKCRSMAITGFDGGEVAKIADYNITVPLNDMRMVESAHSTLLHYMVHMLDEKPI